MSVAVSDIQPAEGVDVLVTGAAGFVGSALVRRLAEQGYAAQGVDVVAGDTPTLQMDVTDGRRVLEVFERMRPRRVVHAAALVGDQGRLDDYQRVNVGGTQNVLDAAAAVRVQRLVHLSSVCALGLDPGEEADEYSPLRFDTGVPYFDTKAASEELVRSAHEERHVPTVVVRPGDVWGPGSEPWVERPLRMLQRRLPVLVGGGRGLMPHCWIDNLVDALVRALEAPGVEGGVYQIHDGRHDTTYRDYLQRLARAAGVRPPRVSVPAGVAAAMGRTFDAVHDTTGAAVPWGAGTVRYLVRRTVYDVETARRELRWAPRVDLDEGMRRLARALRTRAPRD